MLVLLYVCTVSLSGQIFCRARHPNTNVGFTRYQGVKVSHLGTAVKPQPLENPHLDHSKAQLS
jgi:hypothetical protein